jgi:hypothetical protein
MNPSTRSTYPPGLSVLHGILLVLRWIACGTGYFLAYIGWVSFAAGVLCLMLFPRQGAEIAVAFRLAGFFLLPSWGLLRLAEGLFPFGTRLVRERAP